MRDPGGGEHEGPLLRLALGLARSDRRLHRPPRVSNSAGLTPCDPRRSIPPAGLAGPMRPSPRARPARRGKMAAENWSYTSGTSDVPLLGLTIGDMFDGIVTRYPDNEA